MYCWCKGELKEMRWEMRDERWEIERKGGGATGRWEAWRKKGKGGGLWKESKDDERQGEKERKKGKRKGGCVRRRWEAEKREGGVNCTLGLGFFLFILGFFLNAGMVEPVRFGSIGFRLWKPKPNRTGIFSNYSNRFNRFFSRFSFFG